MPTATIIVPPSADLQRRGPPLAAQILSDDDAAAPPGSSLSSFWLNQCHLTVYRCHRPRWRFLKGLPHHQRQAPLLLHQLSHYSRSSYWQPPQIPQYLSTSLKGGNNENCCKARRSRPLLSSGRRPITDATHDTEWSLVSFLPLRL